MKNLLAVILLGLSMSVSADVLDSESTDYEDDDKGCGVVNVEHCLIVAPSTFEPTQTATIPLLFNPHLNRGAYQFDTSWYWRHRGLQYVTPRYR